MKINQLNELVGTVIPQITLKIDKVYPERKEGASKHGPWTVQNLLASDETGKIKLSIWNRDLISSEVEGQTVVMESSMGIRGGLQGLKVEQSEKDGKKYLSLAVSKAAKAQFGAKTTTSHLETNPHVREHVERMEASKPVKTDPSAKLGQYEKLYLECLQRSVSVTREGFSVEFEDIRNIASCFFIQGIKDGLHLQMELKAQTDNKADLENDDIQF